jgi:hypothetical protein
MRGYRIWPIKKRRPESWLAFAARPLEISAIANPSAKAFPRCGFTLERGIAFIYTRTGSTVYVLLAGGVKASQTKDIAKAKEMVCELKRTKQ